MSNFEPESNMTLNELARQAHHIALAHGFYDGREAVGSNTEIIDFLSRQLLLINTEVSEATDCLRDPFGTDNNSNTNLKPLGMAYELADIIIRVLDLADYLGFDIDKAVKRKMSYNATRPFRHGHANF